ncbi:MAG: 30S ribosomal protein S6 [Candidatus Peribacteraceae bacterium]|jgi:ribosomal protein S6
MPTLTPSTEDALIYECAVLYPYPLSQKEEQEIIKEVEKIFEDAGGKQIAKDSWGRRGLAYAIKGYTEGCYMILYYELAPAKVQEIDEALRILRGVLRHLIIKPPKGYEVVEYSEKYEAWRKERSTEAERRKEEREQELQHRVAEKAKRQAKRAQEEKKTTAAEVKKPMEEKKLTEQLEKIISEDEFDL